MEGKFFTVHLELTQSGKEKFMNLGVEWLPLAEYALRSGMSISTLRRKIKSHSIDYRMEEGRYMIRFEEAAAGATAQRVLSMPNQATVAKATPPARSLPTMPFVSDDRGYPRNTAPQESDSKPASSSYSQPQGEMKTSLDSFSTQEVQHLRRILSDNALYLRAMEARVSGLAKKLENFSEQVAELKMLVKIFEEKMDSRG